ncbi:MAG: hypothetical protein ACQEQC_02630 [Elusimicrobiota bacterium]
MKRLIFSLLLVANFGAGILYSRTAEKLKTGLGRKTALEIELNDYENVKGVELDSEDIHIFEKELKNNRIKITLGVYKTGDIKIPVKLYYLKEDMIKEKFLSPVKISVTEKEPEDENIRPLKTVVGKLSLWWIAGAVILLVVIVAVFMGKRRQPQKKPDKILSWTELALRNLKKLKKRNLPGKEKYKDYYEGISYCVREYLENKYSVKALRLTRWELKAELENVLEDKNFNRTVELLKECDLVKFAPKGRKPRYVEKVWDEAFNLIKYDI